MQNGVPAGSVDLRGGTSPAPSASAPPPLKLDLNPARGAGLPSNSGSRGALNLLPPPPERKSKLAEDMQNAGKPDCRKAHQNAGLLAIVPLAQSALSKDGDCKW